ncbi:MAG: fumarylacetoacetate hydrolase family protein [Bacteroidia bacterium]|nr:fumarylacetoacetate hydrolase family protein [Bacteroidia bacterium]MCF8425960.1 fumarylacetoacetate hydrolase family protein [Bacteroidia bacterium]MCF8447589.1 fumarylacetoacetate hydrolase family protein [Bacteroidia bacterium]
MKIFCIGRNYSEHAKELGNAVPENPVVFSKPDTALLKNGEPFYLPSFSNDVHHEVELVIKISKVGKNIQEKFARNYFNEIGLGVDFTARDLQTQLKSKGLPWELAKGFDGSAPIGEFWNVEGSGLNQIEFSLTKNGTLVQAGNTKDMIFSFEKIVSFISHYFTLKVGDLIYTGTPAGVGPVVIGDVLEGFVGDKSLLRFEVK